MMSSLCIVWHPGVNVGRTQLFTAQANYASSRAVYQQVIGLEPGRQAPWLRRWTVSRLIRYRTRLPPVSFRVPSRHDCAIQRRCRTASSQSC